MDVNAGTVFLAALVTALATGIGAVPFIFVRSMSRTWLGISNALAGGVMLGASVGLLRQGAHQSGAGPRWGTGRAAVHRGRPSMAVPP